MLPCVLIGDDGIHRVEPIGVNLYLRLKQHTNHDVATFSKHDNRNSHTNIRRVIHCYSATAEKALCIRARLWIQTPTITLTLTQTLIITSRLLFGISTDSCIW